MLVFTAERCGTAYDLTRVQSSFQGLAGWVTANYLGETLIKGPKEFNHLTVKGLTYGALDWGGASAQITMEVRLFGRVPHNGGGPEFFLQKYIF